MFNKLIFISSGIPISAIIEQTRTRTAIDPNILQNNEIFSLAGSNEIIELLLGRNRLDTRLFEGEVVAAKLPQSYSLR